MTSTTDAQPLPTITELHTRNAWKALGYRVPTKARPARREFYRVPGYVRVERIRHLFSADQVVKIDPAEADKRREAANRGVATRIDNMVNAIESAELTIIANQTNEQIYQLALSTHGGNYLGDPGEFYWSNRKARNVIRHCLTNYESLCRLINRGPTAEEAYYLLRERVDALVDETYPQFAEGAPEAQR